MFGSLRKMYYFCGVKERIDVDEENETFFETF